MWWRLATFGQLRAYDIYVRHWTLDIRMSNTTQLLVRHSNCIYAQNQCVCYGAKCVFSYSHVRCRTKKFDFDFWMARITCPDYIGRIQRKVQGKHPWSIRPGQWDFFLWTWWKINILTYMYNNNPADSELWMVSFTITWFHISNPHGPGATTRVKSSRLLCGLTLRGVFWRNQSLFQVILYLLTKPTADEPLITGKDNAQLKIII